MSHSYQSDYVRLSDAASPTNQQHSQFARVSTPVLAYSDDNDSDVELQSHAQGQYASSWWAKFGSRGRTHAEPPQSGYLTLIPLSDSRLKPRRTKLIVSMLVWTLQSIICMGTWYEHSLADRDFLQLLLTLGSACAVFFLVARGVTVGTIQVHSSQLAFNQTASTYQILLTAVLPIYNPNYMSVLVSGTINVSFYDQQAGFTALQPVEVPARANPEVITVDMDANNVPQKYLFTIFTQCFTFPEKLIFFLTGNLQAEYLGSVFALPPIDNYFIISCNSNDSDTRNAAPQHSLQAPKVQPLQSSHDRDEHLRTTLRFSSFSTGT